MIGNGANHAGGDRKGNAMADTLTWPADRRITVRDLQAATDRNEHWSMLTSYDALTAGVFEQAGVRALLVGDTSDEMVLGHPDTLPVTMDDMVSMVAAVVPRRRLCGPLSCGRDLRLTPVSDRPSQ